ncbi:hypothetical protein Anas_09923 [Armadillidium nasatum]|uniref:EGF-like domain-containing protein n=1 Tax=Armadillidium nasatum TaxID=96803 RepID=A0A5N5SSU8_9CRUS|nr:hypothetical protein Anas_09923 [Armadillidium nasatum]
MITCAHQMLIVMLTNTFQAVDVLQKDPMEIQVSIVKIYHHRFMTNQNVDTDGDCPSQRACINETCVNPCHVLDPCDPSADCKVVDSLPVRTMICICIEGYIMGENDVCQIIPLDITPQCRSDSECGVEKACINRMCKDPCDCGSNAECDVINHRSVCTCQVGFQGNPDIGCFPVGCAINNDCEDDKACYEGVCANPCLVGNPCASNAECYAEQHQAKCRCPSGLKGDGYTQCLVIGCRANSNCPPDRACINNQCKDPCLENPCAPTSECLALNNQAMCRCPPGTYGNPQVRCDPVPEVECYRDEDCPGQHACLNEVCVNPCEKLEPCDDTAICKVIDTLPLRTMLCVCPDGTVIKENGKCDVLPPIKPICAAHEECPSDEACVNGFCKDPCQCGTNADCDIVDHHAVCTCKPGFEGDPEIVCHEIGCYGNDDCATTHACINANCTPVCGPDNEPCGKEAICQGINHQPQCLCPPGLRGNPNTQCIAIGCASNDNCPDNLACVNERCEDPCGLNPCIDPARCNVENHIALCPCPPGFNGTLDKGCERIIIGCRADSECPPELACINGKCTDLCSLNPCGINAKCRTVDTLPLRMAACECLPGYQGDASEICYPVKACPIDKGYITNEEGECECPIEKGFYVDENGNCKLCPVEKGFVMTAEGTCICDPSKGFVITRTGECDCPLPLSRAEDGSCVLVEVTPLPPICTVNDDCPQDRMCENQNCVRPCGYDPLF